MRGLLATVTALCVLLGAVTGVCRWLAVKSQERQARIDIHPYGGVYSMASARYSIRTGGQSRGWFFETFLNYVDAVDLSPHNWSAKERRGKTFAVDDDALVMLVMLDRFRELRSLDLRDTQVTDGGLPHIAALRRLERLDIRGTRITNRGLQKLRQALPDCEIAR